MRLIWINGAFGVGKTTVASSIERMCSDGVWIYDPEQVGFMLRQLVPVPSGDFQDLPSWRRLTVVAAVEVWRAVEQPLVMAMSVLDTAYIGELTRGFRDAGFELTHCLLTADAATLARRISDDPVGRSERGMQMTEWRLRHLQRAQDLIAHCPDDVHRIDTVNRDPDEMAHRILELSHVCRGG